MDNNSKIRLIQNFNIEKYLEWQSELYNCLPEWAANEKEARRQRIWESWKRFAHRIKEDLPTEKEDEEPEISEAAQKAIEDHHQKQSLIEGFQKVGLPIMDFGAFEGVKLGVKNVIDAEIADVREKINLGISTPERVLERRLDYGLELIKPDLLEWITSESPIVERHGFMAISTLSEIGVCQWILKELEGANTKPTTNTKAKREKRSLPFKICLLEEIGFFDLPKVKALMNATGKRSELVAMLLNEDLTNTKKNINALIKPVAGHNPKACLGEVKQYLKEALGDFENLG